MCRDVSPTSKVLVEIQMKSSLPWAKGEHTSKVIDLQKLFDIYWTSKEHELTLTGQSFSHTSPPHSYGGAQKSLTLEGIGSL